MNASDTTKRSHSAVVRTELQLNGQILPIANLGPDFLVLKTAAEHPPGDGEITLWIDGNERRWRVRVEEGLSKDQRRVRIAPCPSVNGTSSH